MSYNGSGQGKSSEQRWKRQRFFFFLNDRESGLFAGLCDWKCWEKYHGPALTLPDLLDLINQAQNKEAHLKVRHVFINCAVWCLLFVFLLQLLLCVMLIVMGIISSR